MGTGLQIQTRYQTRAALPQKWGVYGDTPLPWFFRWALPRPLRVRRLLRSHRVGSARRSGPKHQARMPRLWGAEGFGNRFANSTKTVSELTRRVSEPRKVASSTTSPDVRSYHRFHPFAINISPIYTHLALFVMKWAMAPNRMRVAPTMVWASGMVEISPLLDMKALPMKLFPKSL